MEKNLKISKMPYTSYFIYVYIIWSYDDNNDNNQAKFNEGMVEDIVSLEIPFCELQLLVNHYVTVILVYYLYMHIATKCAIAR